MTVSLIAAQSDNGAIGRDNRLPWHLPADLRRFKELTTGHAVIMGRKTFESIGRPLPDRRCIVITRNPHYAPAGVEVMPSLEAAVGLVDASEEIFVIGGAEVFRRALPCASRIYLTVVHTTIAGDTVFPKINPTEWVLVEEQTRVADGRNPYDLSFRRYERCRSGAFSPERVTPLS